jgi:BirA family transcriptional regulator, biotin operon repressor / biotin---[acetyl-CoA-carboxylase] ligase|tara:strand:- start:1104 stop:1673 length:570 start_codon:yes stop_codon:yes gene_type:complete
MKLKLIKLESVNSTNDEAIKLIKNNKNRPSIITAKIQKKGKGTMGKKWISQMGNIFVSIFFEIRNDKIPFQQFSIFNAYLIKKILSKYSTVKINIKWPNDLLIKKKKICGILQEIINHKEKQYLIIGIGINSITFPANKNIRSTSLLSFSKKNVENKRIIDDIKKTYEKLLIDIKRYELIYLKKKICKI